MPVNLTGKGGRKLWKLRSVTKTRQDTCATCTKAKFSLLKQEVYGLKEFTS